MAGTEADEGVRRLSVDGGEILLETRGQGPPILLLHGWSLDRRIWRPQLDGLSHRFRLIAQDRRGFGESTAPPSLEQEIDDLRRLCEALGLSRMLLVGMSQGGRVALHFARTHPELLAGLVLQGAPLDGFEPQPHGADAIPLDHLTQLAREGRIVEMRAMLRRHPLMRGGAPELDAALAEFIDDYDARDLLAGAPHGLAPMAGALGAIAVPTLVITGTHDTPWRRLVGDALAYGIPGARRATIPGGPHLCNFTHAADYNRLLADFAATLAMAG